MSPSDAEAQADYLEAYIVRQYEQKKISYREVMYAKAKCAIMRRKRDDRHVV